MSKEHMEEVVVLVHTEDTKEAFLKVASEFLQPYHGQKVSRKDKLEIKLQLLLIGCLHLPIYAQLN